MRFGKLAASKACTFHLLEESRHRAIAVHLDWTRGSGQVLRCFGFSLSDHAGCQPLGTNVSMYFATKKHKNIKEAQEYLCAFLWLIVRSAPRTSFHSVHRKITVGVITRFIELGQVRPISLAQLTFFNATIDQAAKAVVQETAFVASTFCR